MGPERPAAATKLARIPESSFGEGGPKEAAMAVASATADPETADSPISVTIVMCARPRARADDRVCEVDQRFHDPPRAIIWPASAKAGWHQRKGVHGVDHLARDRA